MFLCNRCGNTIKRNIADVRCGDIKSCGCLRREITIQRHLIHGLTHTRLYNIWGGIKGRCYNPNLYSYKNYGGRGIKMYEEWKNDSVSFINYCKTLKGWDNPNLSIDRIDNDGNYEPNNLKFSDDHTQMVNRRKIIINKNSKYRTEYIGVSKISKHSYAVSISRYGQRIRLGSFYTAYDAAIARDKFIIENKYWEHKLNILFPTSYNKSGG